MYKQGKDGFERPKMVQELSPSPKKPMFETNSPTSDVKRRASHQV